jgi:hypothetical protein
MSEEIGLGNIGPASSAVSDFMARAAEPLLEGDEFFRAWSTRYRQRSTRPILLDG